MHPLFDLKFSRRFYGIWTLFFGLKIVGAFFLPPVDDEAYYWVWGRIPALGYLDHPGLIGWVNSLGWPPEVFRIPFITANQLSALVLAGTAREHFRFDQRKLLLLLVIFNLVPVVGVGGSLGLPDSFLVLFWVLGLQFSLRLVSDPGDLRSAALLGIALGLGFCSKYHMAIFPLILGLFCLCSHRAFLAQGKSIMVFLAFSLAASLPVLIWNQQNDWISFKFQLGQRLTTHEFSVLRVLEYLGGQILIMSPFLLLGGWRFQPTESKGVMLKYFAFGPLAFFLLSAIRGPVEANWPSIAAPALVLLTVSSFENYAKYAIAYFSAIYAVLALAVLLARERLPEKAKDLFAMRLLARETASLTVLYGASYQVSSQLWFQQNRAVYKPKGLRRVDMFDLWPQPDLPEKFYVAYRSSDGPPPIASHHAVDGSQRSYGMYSVIEMESVRASSRSTER